VIEGGGGEKGGVEKVGGGGEEGEAGGEGEEKRGALGMSGKTWKNECGGRRRWGRGEREKDLGGGVEV